MVRVQPGELHRDSLPRSFRSFGLPFYNLARALRAGDRNAVAALVKRFRFLLARQPNVTQAQHDAVKAYDARLVGLTKLQGKIAAEHQRLQNLLG